MNTKNNGYWDGQPITRELEPEEKLLEAIQSNIQNPDEPSDEDLVVEAPEPENND